jgi:acyl-CoA synthetase (AMP-forming)/AMP-acid ligase II
MLQCFADRGTLAIADLEMDPQSTAKFMYDAGVQFVSATPSYWRRLLMFADGDLLKKIPLVQITLGGEVVDQPILDNLRHHFPKSRLVHIYATTELGRCFSVSDALAGFPASHLNTVLPDGVELKVHDGELCVRSPNSMRMYDPLSSQQASLTDWFGTGDLVEVKDGRVLFVGRKTEMINVAGNKVYPVEVERIIRVIRGVSDVRVFGKSSSIAGELVACEIVPSANENREALKEEIVRTCREKLPSHQQPRLIKFVDRIDLSAAGKTLRSRTS